MYNEQDGEDIATWQIITLVLVIVSLASVAAYAVHNIVKAVA